MRICLMIEGQEGVRWDDWRALAAACETHGLEGLFRSDHYLGMKLTAPPGSLDAWTTLGALAAVTSRIRLGTLVSPVTFRHPSMLAKAVVTADHVSGGRVELGLGTGWWEAEHERYGFPFPPLRERMDMLEEQLAVVHGHWADGSFSFEGRHYRVRDLDALPKAVQRPHPPLILGGEAGPRAARLAARFADEYNVLYVTPQECAPKRDALTAACEEAGRDPATLPLSLMTLVVVGRDEAEVRDRLARLRARTGDDEPEAAVVGTVEQVAERLAEYADQGIQRLMAQHLIHEDVDMVELLGELVAVR
jgi:F420-dependent oxidoreductase-like protein